MTRRGADPERAWQLMVRFFFAQRAQRVELPATEGRDLSAVQCHVLHLIEPGRPLPMRRLAETLSCDASNVTGLVDRLEARGLVERRASDEDRRVKVLVLTPAGARFRTALLKRISGEPQPITRLSQADRRALVRILERLVGDVRRRIVRKRSGIAGFGVFAAERITKNTRIIDYAGETITPAESRRREARQLPRGRIWCFTVNRRWVRDAAVGGNLARFINHSCRPNCYVQVIDGVIWIRAARTIRPGEELSYDYNTQRRRRHPLPLPSRLSDDVVSAPSPRLRRDRPNAESAAGDEGARDVSDARAAGERHRQLELPPQHVEQ